MKLLLFSDLHLSLDAARRIVEQSKGVDVVVGAGDFTSVRREFSALMDVLRAIDRPAVVVAGNAETTEELRQACRSWPSAQVLHGSGTSIQGVEFWGLGGAVPVTPFGSWSYDLPEDEAAKLLAGCPSGGVLVTHSPPKGAVDRASEGKSLGSTSVRDAVLRSKPALVVCGHIHGSAGRHELLGSTPVVNAGPAGMLWEI
jgi:uncharacterized protein